MLPVWSLLVLNRSIAFPRRPASAMVSSAERTDGASDAAAPSCELLQPRASPSESKHNPTVNKHEHTRAHVTVVLRVSTERRRWVRSTECAPLSARGLLLNWSAGEHVRVPTDCSCRCVCVPRAAKPRTRRPALPTEMRSEWQRTTINSMGAHASPEQLSVSPSAQT